VVSSVVPFSRSPSRQGGTTNTGAQGVTLVTPRPGTPTQQQQQQQQAAGTMASVQTQQQPPAVEAAGSHPVLGCSARLADLQQVRGVLKAPDSS
jgi:hypothetical protein